MTRTALYRHFDVEGQLLYVGITNCLSSRDRQHAAKSSWHSQVVRTETEYCLSRDHALALERVAIHFEKPLHNKAHRPQVESVFDLSSVKSANTAGGKALSDYLSENSISQANFAAKIGVKQPSVHRWTNGTRPTWKAAIQIEQATNGNVPVSVWAIQ